MKLTSQTKGWDPLPKPWQILTEAAKLEMARRLALTFDAETLANEYEGIAERYTFSGHNEGTGWHSTSLISSGGDYREIRRLSGVYTKTVLLQEAPATEALLDSLPCEKKRVRYARLMPGYLLDWHYDAKEAVEFGLVRMHIPLIVNPDVRMQVSHVDCTFEPGEFWYADFSFPHRSYNGGKTPKVSIVLELVVNDYVRDLIGPGFDEPRRSGIRTQAEITCDKSHARSMDHSGKALGSRGPATPPV